MVSVVLYRCQRGLIFCCGIAGLGPADPGVGCTCSPIEVRHCFSPKLPVSEAHVLPEKQHQPSPQSTPPEPQASSTVVSRASMAGR